MNETPEENQITQNQTDKIQDVKKDGCLKNSNSVYFNIPEIGIKIPVEKTIKDDLIYAHRDGVVGFSTKTFIGRYPVYWTYSLTRDTLIK